MENLVWVGRKSVTLLEKQQASPACPLIGKVWKWRWHWNCDRSGLKPGLWNYEFWFMIKCIIWKLIFIGFRASGLILVAFNWQGVRRRIQWQLGMLGTVWAFAWRLRKNHESWGWDRRWQDLPDCVLTVDRQHWDEDGLHMCIVWVRTAQ